MLERDYLRFKFNTQINRKIITYQLKFNTLTSFFPTKIILIIFWKMYKIKNSNCLKGVFQLSIKYFHNLEEYQMWISLHWELKIKVKNTMSFNKIKRFISQKKSKVLNNKLQIYPDKVGLATIVINHWIFIKLIKAN